MSGVHGGVCAPKGFTASGVAANIKGVDPERLDCALVLSERPAAAAGTFTTNLVKAAPVAWTEGVCKKGVARAIFANSGNANACTGEQGAADVKATAAAVGRGLGIAAEETCVLSTGVIGVPLPMERILGGVEKCARAHNADGSHEAARAIMTTDTVPKEMAARVALSTGDVTLGAIAKGAGMIAPNMATMFCFITTDVEISPGELQPLLRGAVDSSFNRVCVDNDMSTSDAVVCLANGMSGVKLMPGTADAEMFERGLDVICTGMAKALVRDGEGVTKFIQVMVDGAETEAHAKTIARSIATSQLCKTAFFGEDPNWGRIAAAAGYAGVPFDPNQLSVRIGEIEVMRNGAVADYKEEDAAAHMRETDIDIHVAVGAGPGHAVFWTSDLSHEYVTINADYRT